MLNILFYQPEVLGLCFLRIGGKIITPHDSYVCFPPCNKEKYYQHFGRLTRTINYIVLPNCAYCTFYIFNSMMYSVLWVVFASRFRIVCLSPRPWIHFHRMVAPFIYHASTLSTNSKRIQFLFLV